MPTNSPPSWSRGLLEQADACPSCAKQLVAQIYQRRDNEQSMPDQWRMQQCFNCASLWLNPRPDAESLPRAYDSYYTHNTDAQGIPSGFVGALINGYLNHRFAMQRQPAIKAGYWLFRSIEPWRLKLDYYARHLTVKNVGQPGRLLDIGCGNGDFISRASEMGWQAQGCEIDPKAVAICQTKQLNVLEGDSFHSALDEQRFDVITMSHVIEHVIDQQKLLQRTYELLKPGGYLWIALPNPQSLGLRLSGNAWHALHPPYHLAIPSQPILLNWLNNIGYSPIRALRRGAHVHNVWRTTELIYKNDSACTRKPKLNLFWQAIANTLSTFSTRYAEETVVLAQKPQVPHEH